MKRRDGLDLKKRILEVLKEHGEISLRQLETKTDTNNITILKHVKELEFFGRIEVIRYAKNPKTGRPSTTVKIKKEF